MTEKEFWAIMQAMPEPAPVQFRLYYNEQGYPIAYTTEELPGQWIEIDAETYALAPLNAKVVNGVLKKSVINPATKLVPSSRGTPCHPSNVTIVDQTSKTMWSKQIYDFETN
jgi:hypothetical protein